MNPPHNCFSGTEPPYPTASYRGVQPISSRQQISYWADQGMERIVDIIVDLVCNMVPTLPPQLADHTSGHTTNQKPVRPPASLITRQPRCRMACPSAVSLTQPMNQTPSSKIANQQPIYRAASFPDDIFRQPVFQISVSDGPEPRPRHEQQHVAMLSQRPTSPSNQHYSLT